MYTDPVIPDYSRKVLTELRHSMGLEAYLNHIWQQRDMARVSALAPDQGRTKSAGAGWPYGSTTSRPGVVRLQTGALGP